MVKLIFALIILIFTANLEINAQVSDTLAYLKSIEANKAQYIGQPFSFLKSSLVLTISVFGPVADKLFNINAETSTHFLIKKPIYDDDFVTFPILQIYWHLWLTNN